MVMEKPIQFSIGDRSFSLYWPSLGKAMIVSRLLGQAGITGVRAYSGSPVDTVLLCRNHRDIACRIIAYSTVKSRSEVFDQRLIEATEKYIDKNLSESELAGLLVIALLLYDVKAFVKHYGLDKEQVLRRRIISMKKKNGNNVSFGGKSIYGTMIDTLCQRYGWTMDYVLWGISYPNIQMLLSDAQTSVFLTKEERKRIHIPSSNVIDANDPANMEKIKQMFNE